jgi:hypothetical protein
MFRPLLHCTKDKSVLFRLKNSFPGCAFPLQNDPALCSQQAWLVFILLSLLASLGSEVPNNALYDSSPSPFPVLRRSEGDRVSIICQNYRDPSVNCGGTASKEVCHGSEANDLESVGSLFIQTLVTFSKV